MDTINKKAISTFTVDIPKQIVPKPEPYDSESITVMAILMTADKHLLLGSTFYIDCEGLVKQLSKLPDTDNFPDDPLVNTMRRMFIEYRITPVWVKSHAEKRKKQSQWTFEDRSNWAADQLTRGDLPAVYRLFPYLRHYVSNRHVCIVPGISPKQDPSLIPSSLLYTSQIQDEIQRRHHFLIIDRHQFPISLSKQIHLWRRHSQDEYLVHRQEISERGIKWSELTISFSHRVLQKLGLSPTQVTKLVYDRYWNK